MRAHILQHVPFEGPGCISNWLQARDAVVTTTRLFEYPQLPPLEEIDLLVALGGPISVNDEDEFPWLRPEKRFVREAIDSGMPVLGICLGAQLMASALGAAVYPGTEKEIGWFPVYGVDHDVSAFRFPAGFDAFHWHGETFELPRGAIHLAESEVCAHQAFQVGRRAIGLQFHLETTPESAESLIANCRHELVPGSCIQDEGQLRSVPADRYTGINTLMAEVLFYLTQD